MSNNLRWYQDAGLTVPFSRLEALQGVDGGAAVVDSVAWLGWPVAGKVFEDAVAPGTGQIVVSVVDALTGLQVPASSLRLALSAGGLASATPGAALDLGTQILSGAGNALAVHVRIDAPALAAGIYDNLTLETSETREVSA